MSEHEERTLLSVWNVAFAALFVVLASIVSFVLKLGIESSILVAGARCWIQLTLIGYVLNDVFETKNPWVVLLMTITLTLLGSFEAVFQRSKKRFPGMFLVVLISLASSLVVGALGVRFAITRKPGAAWWDPIKLIPIIGMLVGNGVSGVAIGVGYMLTQVMENQDKIEMYLAFGSTRFECMQPILIESVRLAVTPSINSMAVVGLISIPGMMTGSILGGASVTQAAMYQEVILFLMCASNLISVFACCCMTAFLVCMDSSHRLRTERIVTQGRSNILSSIYASLFKRKQWPRLKFWRTKQATETGRVPLLPSPNSLREHAR